MKVFFDKKRDMARYLAAGGVLCCTTGECWQIEGGCSMNRARKQISIILRYTVGNFFYLKEA